jgi:BirA family transcriptional regulator, biotin operon repressor / biotin---[acetyl-CoA-carboxylase] ligase
MSTSPYDDLERPPLNAASLARGLVRPGGLWREVRVVGETGSTNADLVEVARAGAPEGAGGLEGIVLVAEAQTAGRGRLGRSWVAPPRSGLTFSVLLRPAPAPADTWGWLPLLAGVSAARAVQAVAAVEVGLKWPNDLLAAVKGHQGRKQEGKLGGVLAERTGDAVVIGLGLNVSTRPAELPTPAATSLAIAGAAVTDRDPLLRAILRELADQYTAWRAAAGDADACGLREAYVASCATLGRAVRVELPGGEQVHGDAVGVDRCGQLVVAGGAGTEVTTISAGEVVHVRAGS